MDRDSSSSRRVSASTLSNGEPASGGRMVRFMTSDGFSYSYKYAMGHLKRTGHLPDALPGPSAQQLDAALESGRGAALPTASGAGPATPPDQPTPPAAPPDATAESPPGSPSAGGHTCGSGLVPGSPGSLRGSLLAVHPPAAAAVPGGAEAASSHSAGPPGPPPVARGLELVPEDDSFQCPICDVNYRLAYLDTHVNGKMHRKRLAARQAADERRAARREALAAGLPIPERAPPPGAGAGWARHLEEFARYRQPPRALSPDSADSTTPLVDGIFPLPTPPELGLPPPLATGQATGAGVLLDPAHDAGRDPAPPLCSAQTESEAGVSLRPLPPCSQPTLAALPRAIRAARYAEGPCSTTAGLDADIPLPLLSVGGRGLAARVSAVPSDALQLPAAPSPLPPPAAENRAQDSLGTAVPCPTATARARRRPRSTSSTPSCDALCGRPASPARPARKMSTGARQVRRWRCRAASAPSAFRRLWRSSSPASTRPLARPSEAYHAADRASGAAAPDAPHPSLHDSLWLRPRTSQRKRGHGGRHPRSTPQASSDDGASAARHPGTAPCCSRSASPSVSAPHSAQNHTLRLRPRTSQRRRGDSGQHSCDDAPSPQHSSAATCLVDTPTAAGAFLEPCSLLSRCWQRPPPRAGRPRITRCRANWDALPTERHRPPGDGHAPAAPPSVGTPCPGSSGSSSPSRCSLPRPCSLVDGPGPRRHHRCGRSPRASRTRPPPPLPKRCFVNVWCFRQCHRDFLKQLLTYRPLAEYLSWRRERGLLAYRVNPQLAILLPEMDTVGDAGSLLGCVLDRFLHCQRRDLLRSDAPPFPGQVMVVASDEASVIIRRAWLALPMSSRPRLATRGGTPDRCLLSIPEGHLGYAPVRNDPALFPPELNPPIRFPCRDPRAAPSRLGASSWLSGLVLARFTGDHMDQLAAHLGRGAARAGFFDATTLNQAGDAQFGALCHTFAAHRVFVLADPSDLSRVMEAALAFLRPDDSGDCLLLAVDSHWHAVPRQVRLRHFFPQLVAWGRLVDAWTYVPGRRPSLFGRWACPRPHAVAAPPAPCAALTSSPVPDSALHASRPIRPTGDWTDGLLLARFRGGLGGALSHGIRFCPELMGAFLDTAVQDDWLGGGDPALPTGQRDAIRVLTSLLPGHHVLVLVDPDRRADLFDALDAWNPADGSGDILLILTDDLWAPLLGVLEAGPTCIPLLVGLSWLKNGGWVLPGSLPHPGRRTGARYREPAKRRASRHRRRYCPKTQGTAPPLASPLRLALRLAIRLHRRWRATRPCTDYPVHCALRQARLQQGLPPHPR